MSRNTKILLGVIGGLVVICICLAVGSYLALGRFGRTAVVTDSQKAAEVASSIADFDIPPGYTLGAMQMFGFEWAILDNDREAMIILMQPPQSLSMNQDQLEQQMQQVWQQTSNRSGLNMQVVDRQAVTIRGEETVLTVSEGTDNEGNSFRQAITVFPGKEGQAILMMMIPTEDWDQEMIDRFLQSIR